MSSRFYQGRYLGSCKNLGLANIPASLENRQLSEVDLVESILSTSGITRIAESPSAARKMHEMVTSILDRVAEGRTDPHLFVELANAVVLAKYQAKRKLISDCYADIINYVATRLSQLLRQNDPFSTMFARRARLVFDALIVGIAGKK